MSTNVPTILHSVSSWLPMTMNWVYHQIRHVPNIDSVILADTQENITLFPIREIHLPNHRPPWLIRRTRRLLGLQYTPTNYHRVVALSGAQVLHSHFGDRAWFDLPFVRRHRLHQVVTFYGYDLSMLPRKQPYWRLRYRELFKQANLFLCEGEFMAARLVDLGCSPEKVQIQRLGVEVSEITFVPRQRQDGEPLRVLIAGSFREKKGIPYALKAVGILSKHGVKVEVTVIGDSSGTRREEAEKRAIHNVIRQYNLAPVTHMLGYQPYTELLAQAYKHHIFLSPSITATNGDSEGGAPVSLIDMAASGMPIVSTRHCDIPRIVIHGSNGLLADERDTSTLVDYLEWMANHTERWEAMGRAGRQHVEINFNAQKQGIALGKKYSQLIGNES